MEVSKEESLRRLQSSKAGLKAANIFSCTRVKVAEKYAVACPYEVVRFQS
jgi:hypothetical protein